LLISCQAFQAVVAGFMGRILVADNYASFRQTVVDALAQMAGRLGYDVEGFADGSGLIDAYDAAGGASGVVMVCTDIAMSPVSGMDVVRHIRTVRFDTRTPIIVVSGSLEHCRAEVEGLGAVAMPKPPDMVALRKYCIQCLGIDS